MQFLYFPLCIPNLIFAKINEKVNKIAKINEKINKIAKINEKVYKIAKINEKVYKIDLLFSLTQFNNGTELQTIDDIEVHKLGFQNTIKGILSPPENF